MSNRETLQDWIVSNAVTIPIVIVSYIVIAGAMHQITKRRYYAEDEAEWAAGLWPFWLLVVFGTHVVLPVVKFFFELIPNTARLVARTARWVRDRRREGELPEARVVEKKS